MHLAAVVLRRSRASTGVLCGVLAMPCGAGAFLSAILTEINLHMLWLILAGGWLLVMVLVIEVTLFLTPNRSVLGRSVAFDPVPGPPVLPPNARVVRR